MEYAPTSLNRYYALRGSSAKKRRTAEMKNEIAEKYPFIKVRI
jgi:hypothetical protein